MLTEFITAPEPGKVVGNVSLREPYQALGLQSDDVLPDEALNFGTMSMVPGKAFTLGSSEPVVPVGKAWTALLGSQGEPRTFLIETTPYSLVEALLARATIDDKAGMVLEYLLVNNPDSSEPAGDGQAGQGLSTLQRSGTGANITNPVGAGNRGNALVRRKIVDANNRIKFRVFTPLK